VALGQALEQGQPVGTVGMTGQTSGPHLHFELRRQGSDLLALDPTPHLPPLLPPPSLPPVLATVAP
jgi:murein DD-endopeptidase MepM/ murein hydrolase activator NlpD